MAVLSFAYCSSLKRYWSRKKYQRISGAGHCKNKLKIVRLGGAAATRRLYKISTTPAQRQLKIVSPAKLLAKFHDAYARMMIGLANKIAISNSDGGFFRGKKVAKGRQVSVVSSGEEIDSKLVAEIYKNIVATRLLST